MLSFTQPQHPIGAKVGGPSCTYGLSSVRNTWLSWTQGVGVPACPIPARLPSSKMTDVQTWLERNIVFRLVFQRAQQWLTKIGHVNHQCVPHATEEDVGFWKTLCEARCRRRLKHACVAWLLGNGKQAGFPPFTCVG